MLSAVQVTFVLQRVQTDNFILLHLRSPDRKPGVTHSPCVAGNEATRFQPPCCDASNGTRHRVSIAVGFLDVLQHRQHYR